MTTRYRKAELIRDPVNGVMELTHTDRFMSQQDLPTPIKRPRNFWQSYCRRLERELMTAKAKIARLERRRFVDPRSK
jgi:hypothetical protein